MSVSADGEVFHDFWVAPGVHTPTEPDEGLVARTSPVLDAEVPTRWIRLTPESGRGLPFVSGLRLHEVRAEFPLRGMAALPWMLFLVLVAAARWAPAQSVAEASLRLWRRLDPGLAALMLGGALLDAAATPTGAAVTTLGIAVLLGILSGVTRWMTPENVAAATLSVAVAFGIAPRLWANFMLSRIAEVHSLDVDHRTPPDGDEINSDGARFRGEAQDLRDDEFVVLFLGDSFTYGLHLAYDEAFPAVAERNLRARDCESDVRIVNFGWASSSPLLGFRLLRDVGARYRPDLVVYHLDMTDFHDDLRYEEALRAGGRHTFTPGALLRATLTARIPALESAWASFRSHVALRNRDGLPPSRAGGADALPRDRFFATSRPLAASRDLIERGVMRNLARIREQAESLGAPMALFLLPRAYQHAANESVRSWERARYEVLGPWVLEPFRYFDEVRDDLDYPVFSLLSTFQETDSFPLYFGNDPHWNPDGAALAGNAIASRLVEAGLVPCAAQTR